MYPLAEDHGVLGLLAERLLVLDEAEVPPEIRRRLQERQRAQLFSALSMSAELFRLLALFAAADIEVVTIKGPALSVRAYGDPAIRQYADLDLLVRDRNILRATEVMMEAGYNPRVSLSTIKAEKVPGEYLFSGTRIKQTIDFHTERTCRYYPRPVPVERLFERKVRVPLDSQEAPALSAEDELIFISVHGAKHLWERLIWIADVAALVSRQKTIDWNYVYKAAHETGAGHMVDVGLRLAGELLEAPLPEGIWEKVRTNPIAGKLSQQILEWLPAAGSHQPGIAARASFRVRMCDSFLSGAAYLLRLSLSPTEQDWQEDPARKHHSLMEVLGRPFRLIRKYGREPKV